MTFGGFPWLLIFTAKQIDASCIENSSINNWRSEGLQLSTIIVRISRGQWTGVLWRYICGGSVLSVEAQKSQATMT